MSVRATGRYLRFSARKGKLIADLIRGKRVEDAVNVLKFTPKAAAGQVAKVLDSAVANASQDQSVNVDNLVVKEIFVDQGPTMRRFMVSLRWDETFRSQWEIPLVA